MPAASQLGGDLADRPRLARQPDNPAESAALWRAAEACPTQSIGNIEIRRLFTGDTLHWNHRRGELDVTPEQTFYSWAVLADSMDRLSELRSEWVFPGHGMWHRVGAELYARQMARLGTDMRRVGQDGWARRSDAALNWE